MKFAAEYPLTPRTLSWNVTLPVTALVGMLCVSGSGVCADAVAAPARANAPAVRQAPVSAFARRVARILPYNRTPSHASRVTRDAARPSQWCDPTAVPGPERPNLCRKLTRHLE